MKGPCIQLSQPRVAEFFAGIGLVGHALELEGCEVVFANDIDPVKHRLFAANYDDSVFTLGDIRDIHGHHVPDVDIATASFPCTDLSLAGNRAGLTGDHSGTFWQFTRVLDEMGHRRPQVVMLENVVGFFSSNGGKDLRAAIEELNSLGYRCDLVLADARWFVPQSRPRVFIVGSAVPLQVNASDTALAPRPGWFAEFASKNPDLMLQEFPVRPPPISDVHLSSVIDRIPEDEPIWWDSQRTQAFIDSLSPLQAERVEELRRAREVDWRTAYRRTRNGVPVWEIRRDAIAGCLRTARGGSSKQAVVQVGAGSLRVRWMTAKEYARLQGVPDYRLDSVTESQALFGFGDAVCVPVVQWIGKEYLLPALAAAARERLAIDERGTVFERRLRVCVAPQQPRRLRRAASSRPCWNVAWLRARSLSGRSLALRVAKTTESNCPAARSSGSRPRVAPMVTTPTSGIVQGGLMSSSSGACAPRASPTRQARASGPGLRLDC